MTAPATLTPQVVVVEGDTLLVQLVGGPGTRRLVIYRGRELVGHVLDGGEAEDLAETAFELPEAAREIFFMGYLRGRDGRGAP